MATLASPPELLPSSTAASSSSSPPTAIYKAFSCQAYRARKVKCDRKQPCSRCIRRGEADACRLLLRCSILDGGKQQEERQQSAQPPSHGDDNGEDNDNDSDYAASRRRHRHRSRALHPHKRLRAASPYNTTPNSRASTPGQGDADLLEAIAMGHTARTSQVIGTAGKETTAEPAATVTDSLDTDGSSAITAPHLAALPQPQPKATTAPIRSRLHATVLCEIEGLLPSEETSRALLDYYFTHIEWITGCTDAGRFMAPPLLTAASPASSTSSTAALSRIPPASHLTHCPPALLACHLVILCLSLHFMDSPSQASLGYTPHTAASHAHALFEASQNLAWTSRAFDTHDIDIVRYVVLCGVYQYDVDDQADAHWAMLGMAIKIAQNRGLSRLDVGAASGGGGRHTTGRERERDRRLWWNLIWLDWSHALAHDSRYQIHPQQNGTRLPGLPALDADAAPVEDEADADPAEADADANGTFLHFKSRLVSIYREIVDMQNRRSSARLSFSALRRTHMRIVSLVDALPPELQDDAAAVQGKSAAAADVPIARTMERILTQMTAHNRLLRLHRPFQAVSYERCGAREGVTGARAGDEGASGWGTTNGAESRAKPEAAAVGSADPHRSAKLLDSRRRCIAAALEIVKLAMRARSQCVMLLRYWLVTFFILGAGLVLAIDLLLDGEMPHAVRSERKAVLREVIALFDPNLLTSSPARKGQALLISLMESIQARDGDTEQTQTSPQGESDAPEGARATSSSSSSDPPPAVRVPAHDPTRPQTPSAAASASFSLPDLPFPDLDLDLDLDLPLDTYLDASASATAGAQHSVSNAQDHALSEAQDNAERTLAELLASLSPETGGALGPFWGEG